MTTICGIGLGGSSIAGATLRGNRDTNDPSCSYRRADAGNERHRFVELRAKRE